MCGSRLFWQLWSDLHIHQIAAEIGDSLPYEGLVLVVEVPKNEPPGRHFDRTMGWMIRPEEQDVGDVVIGELAPVTDG